MREGRRETIKSLRVTDTRLYAEVFKGAVGLLVIERVRFAFQAARPAHHRHAAKLAEGFCYTARLADFVGTRRQVVYVKFEIAGDEQIEAAIAVVIAKDRAGAPASARYAGFFCVIRDTT